MTINLLKKSFSQVAPCYEEHARVQKLSATYLVENFDMLLIKPKHILDIGCGTGFLIPLIQQKFPHATLDVLDFSKKMLLCAQQNNPLNPFKRLFKPPISYICGDAHHMPLASNSYDLIVSNLMLQWCDLPLVFKQCKQLLKTGGLLMFATFGPDTLQEIKTVYEKALGQTNAVIDFLDMHNIGDALTTLGFDAPVMSMQKIVERFSSVKDCFYSIKNVGSRRPTQSGLLTPLSWQKIQKAYHTFVLHDGHYPVTYELVFGHAWRANPTNLLKKDGLQHVQLSSIQ